MNRVGVIGGSAVYDIEGLEVSSRENIETPFGVPSGEFVIGTLAGKEIVFLPRHGSSHHILPSEVNFRANIYGMKTLGVDRIISISAVGSLAEEIKPLDILLVDQFIDRTNQSRKMTFFGDGIVAHIPFADPICNDLRESISAANKDIDVNIHNGGTYLNMEGPAFSTKAESNLYRLWNADVIGMTNMAEARLSREAGICYASMAMVTDYDCWREEDESVSVDMILENLRKNSETAKKMLINTIKTLSCEPACGCKDTLRTAIITRPEAVPKKTLENLKPIIGEYK